MNAIPDSKESRCVQNLPLTSIWLSPQGSVMPLVLEVFLPKMELGRVFFAWV